jgi:hypothetical protein
VEIFICGMKFKKLLIESVIDDLDLSKLDKGILKFFNVIRDEKNYTTNRRTGDIANSWDLRNGMVKKNITQTMKKY